ncbi:hypothetical protein BRL93_19110 [Xanthomonas oryzae pv. oryzae]|nr:hypothetical protein BRL93_19110 [Xanthomonas oryzae pv. oryzae]
MPPHSEQIVSRICGALFRGSLASVRRPPAGPTLDLMAYRTTSGPTSCAPTASRATAYHARLHPRMDDQAVVTTTVSLTCNLALIYETIALF